VDFGATKTVSAETVKPGDNLVWKVDARNYGPGSSTNFTVADVLPADVSFASLSTSPSGLTCTTPPVGSTGTISCTAAPAAVPAQPASGSAFTLTITGKVSATAAAGAVLTNLATITGTENEPVPDPHPNRDRTFTRVVVPDEPLPPEPPVQPVPDPDGNVTPSTPPTPPPPPPGPVDTTLSLTKKAAASRVQAGGTTSFTLKVANTGDASALEVKVCDALPASVSLVSAPGFAAQGGKLCVSVGTLAPGASQAYALTVRVSPAAPARIVNNATASASDAKIASAKAAIRVSRPAIAGGQPAGVTG
jgi:uncharacterized repeat protein (TIGR01451 family)